MIASACPMFDPPNPRYKGKAFLRILELYVIWVFGELPAKEASILQEMTPNLRATFQREGHWQPIVEARWNPPRRLPGTIRKYWNRDSEIARAAHVVLSSQQFAEMFVDENFAQ
jgi:hypothetical protein